MNQLSLCRAGTRDTSLFSATERKSVQVWASVPRNRESQRATRRVGGEMLFWTPDNVKKGTHKGADEYLAWNGADSSSEPLSYSKQVMSYKPKRRYNPDRRLYKIPERVSLRNSAYILIRCEPRSASGLISTCLQLPFEKVRGSSRACKRPGTGTDRIIRKLQSWVKMSLKFYNVKSPLWR